MRGRNLSADSAAEVARGGTIRPAKFAILVPKAINPTSLLQTASWVETGGSYQGLFKLDRRSIAERRV